MASRAFTALDWLAYPGRREYFQKKCNAFYVDLIGKSGGRSNYFNISKALSGKRRHYDKLYLFNESDTMSLGNAFTEVDWANPFRNGMSPSDFAALLLANDKKRFRIEILVHWK